MTRDPSETASIETTRAPCGEGAYLLVVDGGASWRYALPPIGIVTVGRSADVELEVQHPSVSRKHARLVVDAGELRVTDLGSHNGTKVNGEPLAATRTLVAGDVVAVGEVLCIVHARPRRAHAREKLDEAGWRRRLDDEVERAVTYRRPLGVLAIPRDANIATVLRGIDIAGATETDTLVCLPEADGAASTQLAEQIARGGVAVGLATCPFDATDADSLVLAARAGARIAKPGQVGVAADAFTRLVLGDREVLIAHPSMVRVFELLQRLAAAELSVLITGETGTGKEAAAHAVHHHSARAAKPFIAVNCAALPESLVESALFGHDRGAFTGAATAKPGLLEDVAGGTLFLDEIGELALPVQAKLLRALETQRITRLGERKEREIDVRIVAATHRALDKEIEQGRFRQDLYFRIGAARVFLPPLRDRRCEVPVLFRDLLAKACARAGREAPAPTPGAMHALLAYDWPGNVRELKHVAEYVAATVLDDRIEPEDLPGGLTALAPEPAAQQVAASPLAEPSAMRSLADEIEEVERRRMTQALVAAGGVKTRAAQLLGMPIRTFTMKVKQYGL